MAQAKQHGLPGGEEEEKALEEAAAPTDIPRLFAPGRLLYLSQPGDIRPVLQSIHCTFHGQVKSASTHVETRRASFLRSGTSAVLTD
jgi:hypothetical protein